MNSILVISLIVIIVILIFIFRKNLKKAWFKIPGFEGGIETHDIKSGTNPYLLPQSEGFKIGKEVIHCIFGIENFGAESANDTRTFTEIYINGTREFQSGSNAQSVTPPKRKLMIETNDPLALVTQCLQTKPNNKYLLIVKYRNSNGKEFRTEKSFYYVPGLNKLSTREEMVHQ